MGQGRGSLALLAVFPEYGQKKCQQPGHVAVRGTWQSGALRQLPQVGMLGLLNVGHEPV